MGQVMIAAYGIANPAESGGHHVEYAARRVRRDFLFQPRHADPIGKGEFPVISRHLTVDQLEQSRFTGAIAPDQRDTLTLFQGKADAIQQGMAVTEVYVRQIEQGHENFGMFGEGRRVSGGLHLRHQCRRCQSDSIQASRPFSKCKALGTLESS